MSFGLSFLGALFAIVVSLLIVYTYVTWRLLPRLMRGLRAYVEEIGPRAVFERAHIDPAEAMRQLGVSSRERISAAEATAAVAANGAVRVVFTCEDHGRCAGCPKVLAQFEAIIKHQGAESVDEVEQKCYTQLRELLASDTLLDGESEADRQKRIAARVIETLIREGAASSIAHAVVWSRRKEDRSTFAGWLSAARTGCEEMTIADEEDVA